MVSDYSKVFTQHLWVGRRSHATTCVTSSRWYKFHRLAEANSTRVGDSWTDYHSLCCTAQYTFYVHYRYIPTLSCTQKGTVSMVCTYTYELLKHPHTVAGTHVPSPGPQGRTSTHQTSGCNQTIPSTSSGPP